MRVLILKKEGERKTKHENAYPLREGVRLLWHKVGMEIKHKDESAKSIRELFLNPRNMLARELFLNPRNVLAKWHPRPPFYSNKLAWFHVCL